jgi:hypothetical protein
MKVPCVSSLLIMLGARDRDIGAAAELDSGELLITPSGYRFGETLGQGKPFQSKCVYGDQDA